MAEISQVVTLQNYYQEKKVNDGHSMVINKAIHKIEWANYGNDRVRFVGEVSECGAHFTIGSKIWKYVTCRRCIRIWDKGRKTDGIRPRK